MLTLIFFGLSILNAKSDKIKSYNMNKFATDSFDFDCLHTTESSIFIPSKITVCYRFKPISIHHSIYGTVFMGNFDANRTEVEIGFDYSVWASSGPWVGLREKGQSVVWVGMGDGDFELLTWRHTCISINFEDGHSILFENGKKYMEGTFKEYVVFKEKMPEKVNFISLGCGPTFYKGSFVGVLSDLQIFGRILSTLEMKQWTGCRERLYGDVINWETENWSFNTTGNQSEVEYLDFNREICNTKSKSSHVFPLMVTFFKALEICKKVTGKLFQ